MWSEIHFTGTSCQLCRNSFQSHELLAEHLLRVRHPLPPLQRVTPPTTPLRLREAPPTTTPGESWLNSIRRVFTSVVQYTQVPDATAERGYGHLPVQQASRSLAFGNSLVFGNSRSSAFGNSRFQHPLAPQFPGITNTVIPSVPAIPPLQQDSPASVVSSSRRLRQPRTHQISADHQAPPVRRASRTTTSQGDRTASNGTWAGLFDAPLSTARQSQHQSALPSNASVRRRIIAGSNSSHLDPTIQAARIGTTSVPGPTLVRQVPRQFAPPISAPAPPRPAPRNLVVQQAPVRRSPQIAAPSVPSQTPSPQVQQSATAAIPALIPRQSGTILRQVQQPLLRTSAQTATPQAAGLSTPSLAPVPQAPRPPATSSSPPTLRQTAYVPPPVQFAPPSLAPPNHRRDAQQAIRPQGERPSLPPPVRCQQCNRHFNTRHALNRHRSSIHTRNPIPDPVARAREIPDAPRCTCMSCHRTFINQYALDQHLVSNAHPENQVGGRPGHRCVECGLVFGTRDLLTLHAAEHVQERMRRG